MIDQERALYNEEREKKEEDIEKLSQLAEAKIRLIKNRLLGLYDGDIELGRELPIEDIIDRIASRITRVETL